MPPSQTLLRVYNPQQAGEGDRENAMAQTDRTTGLVGHTGIKAPVKVASTANLTLSGEQTIDGIACVDGDRVLVKDQTTASENGIWVVDTGSWSRAKDFNGSYDAVRGTMVRVNQGDSHASGLFVLTTTDPITIGTTSLTFSRSDAIVVLRESQVAAAGQTVFNLGVTYQLGSENIAVFLNGLRAREGDDYSETSTSRITFAYALQEDDEVDVYVGQQLGSLTAAQASLVALTDAGDFYVGSTVEAVLQEIRDAITEDNGDASATLTYNSSTPVQRWDTPLTANRTATLSTSNAREGAHFVVVRGSGATGNFTLAVGSLATLRAPGEWCEVRYDAGTSAWVLEKYGHLPSAGVRAIGADNGDASATLVVGTDEETQYWGTALTEDRTATLSTTGAWNGARFRIARTEAAIGNFALNVVVGSSRLLRLAPGQWCTVEYTGSTWMVSGFGELRPGSDRTRVVELYDDFVGEELDSYRWGFQAGSDAEVIFPTVLDDQVGGVVRLTTGDDAAASMAVNGVQLQSQLNWKANQGGLSCEFRVALDLITSVALFIGLTDQRAALEIPFTLAAGDALTSTATDAVGVLFDTDADSDNWWLVGVKADVDATKQDSGVAPAAGTFETWRIELDADGTARFYRNGSLIGTAMSNALTPSVALTPVVAAFSRSASSRNVDVDMIHARAQR